MAPIDPTNAYNELYRLARDIDDNGNGFSRKEFKRFIEQAEQKGYDAVVARTFRKAYDAGDGAISPEDAGWFVRKLNDIYVQSSRFSFETPLESTQENLGTDGADYEGVAERKRAGRSGVDEETSLVTEEDLMPQDEQYDEEPAPRVNRNKSRSADYADRYEDDYEPGQNRRSGERRRPVRDFFVNVGNGINNFVQENPWWAVGIGSVAGGFIGARIQKRRDRNKYEDMMYEDMGYYGNNYDSWDSDDSYDPYANSRNNRNWWERSYDRCSGYYNNTRNYLGNYLNRGGYIG